MIDTIIYAGPSLPKDVNHSVLESKNCLVKPPVSAGEIYCLLNEYRELKRVIIIDGYFYNKLAVLHREIISALSQKVIVIGSSSLGALRAVELNNFGMIGVGRVYDYYNNHPYTGDDEVAILHDKLPPYKAITVPLINLRILMNELVVKRYDPIFIFYLKSLVHYLEQRSFADRTWDLIRQFSTNHSTIEDNNDMFSQLKDIYIDYKVNDCSELIKRLMQGYHFSQNTKEVVCRESISLAQAIHTTQISSLLSDDKRSTFYNVDHLVSVMRLSKLFSEDDIGLELFKDIIYEKHKGTITFSTDELIEVKKIIRNKIDNLNSDLRTTKIPIFQEHYMAKRQIVFKKYLKYKIDQMMVSETHQLMYKSLVTSSQTKSIFKLNKTLESLASKLEKISHKRFDFNKYMKEILNLFGLNKNILWEKAIIERKSDIFLLIKRLIHYSKII